MMKNSNDLTNINFDSNWKCYYQFSSDKMMVSAANNFETDHRWSSVELPHIDVMIKRQKHEELNSYQWWYCKEFNGISTDKRSEQQLYLMFETCDGFNNNSVSSNITDTIWLNNTQIFSGSLMALSNPIELPSKLLRSENTENSKHDNIVVICCSNTSLSLHARLILHGKIIYATGQVSIDEEPVSKHKEKDVLDYTVSVDDNSGRIDVVFKSKKKYKAPLKPLLPLTQYFGSDNDEKQSDTNKEELKDDLLIPRLAIVILIVGTRGDVQPFIA